MSPLNIQNPTKGSTPADRLTVPCGRCGQCMATKRNEWTYRLRQEEKTSLGSYFVTLTYNEENIRKTEYGITTLVKKELSDTLKLLRKQQQRNKKLNLQFPLQQYNKKKEKTHKGYPSLRYYAVGEYGTKTDRPHYHALLFNTHLQTIEQLITTWSLGIIDVQPISSANIHYITKFHINKHHESIKELNEYRQRPFTIISTVPPIGAISIMQNKKWARDNNNFFLMEKGIPIQMPTLFKKKFFTKMERKINAYQSNLETEKQFDEHIEKLSKVKQIKNPYSARNADIYNQSNQIIQRATKGDKL